MEIFTGEGECPGHIAQLPQSAFYDLIKSDKSDRFYVLISNQVLGMKTCCCTYWIYEKDSSKKFPQWEKQWNLFLEESDEYRNSRFKVYPRIKGGSWMLQKLVPNV